MDKKYILELNGNQIRLVKDAMEEYFRIRMGQWGDLADSMARKNIDLDPENPHFQEYFNVFIAKRDAVENILTYAGKIAWGTGANSFIDNPKSEEQRIAEGIWQVIRHELWKQNPNRDEWCVDSRKPMQFSNEPLPKLEVNTEYEKGIKALEIVEEIEHFLEAEICQTEERLKEPCYAFDGAKVSTEQAKELNKSHIRFCNGILKIIDKSEG